MIILPKIILRPSCGFMALATVLIIGAAILTTALAVSLRGLDHLQSRDLSLRAHRAAAVAEACLEEGLLGLRRDATYGSGGPVGPVSIGDGSCIIEVTISGANERRLKSVATLGSLSKIFEARVSLTATGLQLLDWRELSG